MPFLAPLVPLLIAGLKFLLIKLVGAVIVYFLYRLLISYSSTLIDWAMAQITSNVDLSQTTIQFTGMAAWLANTLQLSQCITLLISFLIVRFLIGIVRG